MCNAGRRRSSAHIHWAVMDGVILHGARGDLPSLLTFIGLVCTLLPLLPGISQCLGTEKARRTAVPWSESHVHRVERQQPQALCAVASSAPSSWEASTEAWHLRGGWANCSALPCSSRQVQGGMWTMEAEVHSKISFVAFGTERARQLECS